MSIYSPKGLYVLAYRKLRLDIRTRTLKADEEITICTEFTIDGVSQSVRQFLDAEDYGLLENFELNQEKIKDCIMKRLSNTSAQIDDMPYIIGLGMDIVIDLDKEYKSIIKMYQEGNATVPIKAFFGDLINRPKAKAAVPIALINQNINMDQLLAINNAMKFPVSYVQGPPGTGKTNTIINTIITAFFNEQTVLFVSYNNHPINGVYEKLESMTYKGNTIPFPILRLGSRDRIGEAISHIEKLYTQSQIMTVYESTLDRNKAGRKQKAKALSELLKKYEEGLDLQERKETLKQLAKHTKENSISMQMLSFQVDLTGRQLDAIDVQMGKIGNVSDEAAMQLLDRDVEELKKYLYYTSAKYIKKLDGKKFSELRNILFGGLEDEEKIDSFTKYLREKDNIKKLQEVFPVIATTCVSAQRLGEPEPMFDMTIMDEASQCNVAVSLVPIVRGERLMLVGDPQQLNPVILLNDILNAKLKKQYRVTNEYDYCKNSIYKTFLACDSVSDEILLHNHYRCNPQIIGFNNHKYYNSKLNIKSNSKEDKPLEYVDIQDATSYYKNTSPAEARAIAQYAVNNKDKSIGIITPFVHQKELIEKELKSLGVDNVLFVTLPTLN